MNQSFLCRLRQIVIRVGMTAVAMLLCAVAWAQTPTANVQSNANLKKIVEERLGVPHVDAITKLPYAGLYEVRLGTDIIYTDAHGDYLFIGNIVNLQSRENLTKKRVDALVAAATPPFKFSELPFDSAVKIVHGNGKQQLAVFEDPNCGFCRRFEKTLSQLDDVTIYVFLYPILGPDSIAKAKSIWCSPDRVQARNDWMQARTAPTAPGDCKNPIDQLIQLGQKMRVNGTPMTFFANGRRLGGAVTLGEMQKALNQ